MIEIKIPKEITEYKEKFLFGLTIRQCVCAVAALAVCVPLYIFGKDFLGDDVVGWLVILIAVPIFAFGFFRYDGMPFEKFLALLYSQKWVEPQENASMRNFPFSGTAVMKYPRTSIAHQIAEQTNKIRKERKKK